MKWCQELSPLHDAREYDVVVATGEQVTIGLLAIALQTVGVEARSWQGWQIPIVTDGAHGKARVESIDGSLLIERMRQGQVPVPHAGVGVDAPQQPVVEAGPGGHDLGERVGDLLLGVPVLRQHPPDRQDLHGLPFIRGPPHPGGIRW